MTERKHYTYIYWQSYYLPLIFYNYSFIHYAKSLTHINLLLYTKVVELSCCCCCWLLFVWLVFSLLCCTSVVVFIVDIPIGWWFGKNVCIDISPDTSDECWLFGIGIIVYPNVW